MEQNTTTTTTAPQGKGMGVAGFVISLVAIVLWIVISGIALLSAIAGGGMGLAAFWLILSLLGTILSVLGMIKLGKTGGKRGLAITGMIIGIVASLLSVKTIVNVSQVHSTVGDSVTKALGGGLDSLNKAMEQLKELTDTTKTH